MSTRLAFLASHNGSSARAITRACAQGIIPATPVLMISNNPASAALTWAAQENLACLVLNAKTREDVDQAMAKAFKDHRIDLVCCSGYMKLIGPASLAAMAGHIWNVHPALLPAYGGKGMYGRHVHEAVHAARDSQTGITLHKVDGEYDHGDVIAQKIIPLDPGDSVEEIEQKTKAAEPDFYIETLAAYLTSNQTA